MLMQSGLGQNGGNFLRSVEPVDAEIVVEGKDATILVLEHAHETCVGKVHLYVRVRLHQVADTRDMLGVEEGEVDATR